jgi:hypothetical protein
MRPNDYLVPLDTMSQTVGTADIQHCNGTPNLSAEIQGESLTCETSQPQPTKIENSVSENEASL